MCPVVIFAQNMSSMSLCVLTNVKEECAQQCPRAGPCECRNEEIGKEEEKTSMNDKHTKKNPGRIPGGKLGFNPRSHSPVLLLKNVSLRKMQWKKKQEPQEVQELHLTGHTEERHLEVPEPGGLGMVDPMMGREMSMTSLR